MLPALVAAVSLAVQPDTGALTLALNGQPVITGVLAQDAAKVAGTTARQDSPTRAAVHVDYTDGSVADYTYTLDGNDCALDYTLTNKSGGPQTINLGGWKCAFASGVALQGTMPSWHWTYYANRLVWHPSLQSPLGAVYETDERTAAVFYSPSEFERQSLLNAAWGSVQGVTNPFQLEFRTDRAVAPGASGHVSLVMRVTDDLSQEGLHGGYKRFLSEKYPSPLYQPAPGPVAQFSSVDAVHVKPDNPHGYNGDTRRIDHPEGVEAFLHWMADPLAAGGGQGCIFWAPGGVDPVMYPPDFDANLERVADTWPALVAGFRARKLRVGVCARAAENVDRSQRDGPVVTPIDPDDPKQVETLLARFRRTAKMGVDAYYLDTFGHTWASTRLLPAIRRTVGPDAPIYTEYCTDATLPYADRYCEYQGGDTVVWDSPQQLAALQFLFPESVWLCVSRTGQPWPKEDFRRLRLTPMIGDYQVGEVLRSAR